MLLRKSLLILIVLTLFTTLFACDVSITSENSTDEIKAILDAWIPSVITHETMLPLIEGTTIQYTLNQVPIESLQEVEKPLYDQKVIIDAKVFGNDKTITFSYETILLSSYSPRHDYVLHFDAFDMSQLSRDILQENHIQLKQYDDVLLNAPIMLRGRGNSSFFTFEKKSLKIEFEQNITWMGLRGNSFNLLAMHSDKSLMRDALGHTVSNMLDLEITQAFRYVQVYIGGIYYGLYLLIEDRTYIKTDALEDTLDFAVEVDRRIEWEGFIEPYILIDNMPHSIKRPINPTQTQSNDISTYLQHTLNTLKQGHVPSNIDIKNWMQFLFVHELFKNVDAWGLSIFMYQSSDEILKFGPVWDFDLSVANADYVNEQYLKHDGFYLLNHPWATWFKDTMQIQEFNTMFKTVVQTFYTDYFPTFIQVINTLSESLIPYANMNFNRWDILNEYTWPNPYTETVKLYNITYPEQTQFVKEFLSNRLIWLNEIVMSTSYRNKQY